MSVSGENVVPQTRVRGRRRNKRSLKWATLNARSLNNKMELLRKRAKDYEPQILSVTESWAAEETGDSAFMIENYTIYRSDRVGRRGSDDPLY